MRPRRTYAAAAGATAAAVLGALAPVVFGTRTLSHHDTDRLYAPIRTLVVEELRAGRLPLWNPYEGTGRPLLAEGVHGVLHPISLLAAAVAPASIDALLLAYLVAAALGAFTLAAALGASGPASAAAGVAFALSGFSVSMTGNLVFLAGLATLPWVLAAARAAGAGARWGAVSTALATACAFLAGDAQVALVGLALGLLLAADAGGLRGALRALAAAAAGVLLAGVQIAPTRSLLPLTHRGLELSDEQKRQWALAPARLLEWVVPGLFRGPTARWPADASGPRPDALPFAESVFLGAPLLAAAALALRRSGGRTVAALAAAAVALLWLALGHHLGARQLLDVVPVWNQFRYSEKLMAPLALCLCALAALGIDAFGAAPLARGARHALAATAACVGALLLALRLAADAADALALGTLGPLGSFYRSTLAAGLPHLLVAVAALLAVDRLRGGRARAGSLAALVAGAAAAALGAGVHLGARDAHRPAAPLRLAADAPAPRIAHPVIGSFDAAATADPVESEARIAARALLPAHNVAARLDSIEPYTGFEPLRLTALSIGFGDAWSNGFRRFGLTHVVIPLPRPARDRDVTALAVEGGHAAHREDGLEVWAVPHRPWAFFASAALAVADPDLARGLVLDLAARGEDGTVVVEAAAAPATSPGRVLDGVRDTRTLRVDAEASGPGLLVVQEAFWPGWHATVDGQPAEILAADALVRAVRWPAGRHRLEMTYDPPELSVGLALSAAGAALVLLLAAAAARGRSGPVR